MVRRTDASRRIVVFFMLVTAVFVFLVTPASSFLWEAIPSAAFVQFPWRFLGPAAFTLAMCVGYVFREDRSSTEATNQPSGLIRRLAPYAFRSAVLVALLVSALPNMYPPLWDANFGDTSPRAMIDFELSGVALGTTSTGDFLPTPVGREPGPTSSLLDSYGAAVIDKFDHTTLPVGATAQAEAHSANYDRIHVESPIDFKGRLLTFLFPGWTVLIDGVMVPLTPLDQSGFIEFQIPAGPHTIEATLSATEPQLIGGFISFGALVAIFVLGVSRRRSIAVKKEVVVAQRPSFALDLLLISLLCLGVKIAVVDHCDACFRYTSPAGQALGAQHQQRANFGGHIELLGYDLPSDEVASGQMLPLTLYWHATAPVPNNYQVFVHLSNPATTVWGQSDKLNPGDFPSTRWPLDRFVWDDHRLQVLPGTPPGEYRLSVGLYQLGNGQRAPVFDEGGQIVGDNVVLDTVVRVVPPPYPPSIEALQMQQRIDRDYGGAQLLGWSIEAPIVQTPNFARLTLFWQSTGDPSPVRNVRTELIDRAGEIAQTIEASVPALPRGEIRRDQIGFWLPPEFPAGAICGAADGAG